MSDFFFFRKPRVSGEYVLFVCLFVFLHGKTILELSSWFGTSVYILQITLFSLHYLFYIMPYYQPQASFTLLPLELYIFVHVIHRIGTPCNFNYLKAYQIAYFEIFENNPMYPHATFKISIVNQSRSFYPL